MNKIEVLSPAGDLEKLKWALMYGADAVYFGGYKYNLRANTSNFSLSDIKEAVTIAHSLNKKVYVTVNMQFHNDDLNGLDEYLTNLNEIGVDAIIVSDIAVIEAVNRLKLDLVIHLSTQISTTNYESIKFWEGLGVKRVVLARECSKEDILDIRKHSDIELETFIHGAMCTSYSGRCVLSNYVTLRDSNRGGCSQVCRFNFDIEGCPNNFSISTKDLNMIDYIPEMIDLGITSLKIEGRMRSIYYIATVVNAYKNIVNKYYENKLTKEIIEYYKHVLHRCANRESAPQFFDNTPGANEQIFTGRVEISNQDFLGVVLSYDKEANKALVEQRNYFEIGSAIEVFGPNKEAYKFVIESITDEEGATLDAARHPQQKVFINMPTEVCEFDIMRASISVDKKSDL